MDRKNGNGLRGDDESNQEYDLFVNNSEQSRSAERMLRECGVHILVSEVDNPYDRMDFRELPTLIGGKGYWSGFDAIERFITNECERELA
jgi:hypothetical protein